MSYRTFVVQTNPRYSLPSKYRLVHVPPCTGELSLATMARAFFLLYAEGRGPDLFNAQAGRYLYKNGRCELYFNCTC
jgi:hypothetical protein